MRKFSKEKYIEDMGELSYEEYAHKWVNACDGAIVSEKGCMIGTNGLTYLSDECWEVEA